jgi:sugar phosphate isomerase/epimerase
VSPFSFCLNTSTIRPTPLVEKIRIAGALGYDAIEPWNDEVDAYLDQGGSMADLVKAISDHGLRVASMIALFDWTASDPSRYSASLVECRRRMEQAADLGSPYIVASPPNEVVDLNFAADRFAQLMEMGREVGVLPSMEFLGFVEGVHTLESARRIAGGKGHPDATIVADVFHLLRGGGSIDDLLQITGDRMAIFHINDLPASPPATEQTDSDRVMIGEGVANLPRVIANLRTIGYSGPLSLELFSPRLWEADPISVCREGLDRMRSLAAS